MIFDSVIGSSSESSTGTKYFSTVVLKPGCCLFGTFISQADDVNANFEIGIEIWNRKFKSQNAYSIIDSVKGYFHEAKFFQFNSFPSLVRVSLGAALPSRSSCI